MSRRHLGDAPVIFTRLSVPQQMEQSARWSAEPEMNTMQWLITALRGIPPLLNMLEKAAERRGRPGPARRPGSWVLVYMAYVISRKGKMQPFWFSVSDDYAFWRMCGFQAIPSYQVLRDRFVELEDIIDVVEEAVGYLVQRLRRDEPRIGMWLHVDATEADSNSPWKHDCMPGENCPGAGTRRVSAVAAAELRRAATELAVDAEERGEVSPPLDDDAVPVRGERVLDPERRGVRIFDGVHWHWTHDIDAGRRAYTVRGETKKAWDGYYDQIFSCHYSGLPLIVRVFPANENEGPMYSSTFNDTCAVTGVIPFLIAGDRAYGFRVIYQFNTMRGVGSVFQYRKTSGATNQAPGTDVFDVHGVPMCKHCGGITDFVRFRLEPDGPTVRPRLWTRCAVPLEAECRKEQATSCSQDWRRLLPVWRTHEAYQAMRQSHQSFERLNSSLRATYKIAGITPADRPSRLGRNVQQLRASVAVLIEWLRFFARPKRALTVVTTESQLVRFGISRRRARLGLVGGGIAASARDDTGPLARPPTAA